ncbi:hypothetical protein D9M69_474380 [compost metagenome]
MGQLETTDIEIGVVIALGVDGRAVLDEHTVVIRRGGVLDLVAGLDPGDRRHPFRRKGDGYARIVHRTVRVLDHLPGADVDDSDIGDGNRRIVCITVDEVLTRFGFRGECADFHHRRLAALQLHDIKAGRPHIEDVAKVDVGFDVGFVLIQVGNGPVLPGAGDEGKADALLFRDHLIVGAEGGRATCLAGIDRVASRDVDAG